MLPAPSAPAPDLGTPPISSQKQQQPEADNFRALLAPMESSRVQGQMENATGPMGDQPWHASPVLAPAPNLVPAMTLESVKPLPSPGSQKSGEVLQCWTQLHCLHF